MLFNLNFVVVLAAVFGASASPSLKLETRQTKQVSLQFCNSCTGTLDCSQTVWSQDYGQAQCDAPATGLDSSFTAGESGTVTTYGEDCTYFEDADLDSVDVGAGVGHMDCPSQIDVRCNKDDQGQFSVFCGLNYACQRLVVCQW